MPAWPTGAETKVWMRSDSIGDNPEDLATLNETTAAAEDTLRGRLDPALMQLSGTTITRASLTANIATLTTSVKHGLTVGDTVTVSGVVPELFNGSYVLTAVSPLTLSYAKVNANIAEADATGSWVTVDRCPHSVALAVKVRAAALFVRRDSANGVIRISPDLAVRINRFDSDVDNLIARYTYGPDPAPGSDD